MPVERLPGNTQFAAQVGYFRFLFTSGKDSRRIVTLATCAGNVVGNRFQRTGRGNPDESIS
jgi:hypothetical protein